MADERILANLRVRYAEFVLGIVHPEDLPSFAWDALEVGLEGSAILRMAALDRPRHFEVRDMLPAFWAELGIAAMSKKEAGIECAKAVAEHVIEGSMDLVPGLRSIREWMWRSGYPIELGWADEADLHWLVNGKTEEDARYILANCAALLGVPVPEPTAEQLERFLSTPEPPGANFHRR